MYYFIVNPKSRTGKGLEVWKCVKTYLRDNNISYRARDTKYEGHATELARNLCELPKDKINLIVIGGDGTVNEVLCGITDFGRINFGVIPTGSGNDFARGLGIKGKPLEVLAKLLMSEKTEAIDMGKINYGEDNMTRYFAISSGVGLDAIVCKKALTSKLKQILNKLHLGKLTYIILTVHTLFSMETVEVKVSFDEGEEKEFNKLIYAAAMNFRAEGGGVPMAPKADMKDGLLSVCFAHGIPKWRTFFCLPLLVMAKHEKLKGFDVIDCKKCKIALDKPVVLHADGEYIADVDKVTFTCLPTKLNLMV